MAAKFTLNEETNRMHEISTTHASFNAELSMQLLAAEGTASVNMCE